MLQLLGNRIQGQVMGKLVSAQTLPTAFAGGRTRGVYQLLPPGADPVFGDFVIALPIPGGASGGNRQGNYPDDRAAIAPDSHARAALAHDWKMPAGGASFPKMRMPAGGASVHKIDMPTGGASFPKMDMPAGGASFWKTRMPAGPESATFIGGGVDFTFKGGSPASKGSRIGEGLKTAAGHFTVKLPASKGGVGDIPFAPIVLAQRMIPGRFCLVVTSGFADLLDALRAAGGANLTIV